MVLGNDFGRCKNGTHAGFDPPKTYFNEATFCSISGASVFLT